MSARYSLLRILVLGFALFLFPTALFAMTGEEILKQVAKQNLGDSFRLNMTTKTMKGTKVVSSHNLWLMGRMLTDPSTFFLDFEAPPDSKGLRFLLIVPLGKEPKAFMYLPATGKTLPIAIDDPSVDIGGTGLMTEDVQGFVPRGDEKATVTKEEKVDGRDCYVLRVSRPGEKGERHFWVTKDNYIVIKTEALDAQGKVTRSLRVVEFFKTSEGKEFPREEEITIPGKDSKIVLRQEHAVFGIEIPQEVLDPEKFGTFKWRQ